MIGFGSRRPRPGLPPIPARMLARPIDERGYPVPWFVEWIDGKPDFRVMDRIRWSHAVRFGFCWLCGEPCGKYRTFVIGPMCAVNRTTSEPPCHDDCALFAVRACPFMLLPRARRHDANLPGDYQQPAGEHLERNPGAYCLWTTSDFSVFRVGGAQPGSLIRIGEPAVVRWYAEGRPATRDQVQASITSGLPFLEALAAAEGPHALAELRSMVALASKYLP